MADAGADPWTLPGNDPWASFWPPANLSNNEPTDPGAQAPVNEATTSTAAPLNAGQSQNGEWWGNHSWAAENPARDDNANGESERRPSTTSTSTTTASQRQGNDQWQWRRGDDRWWNYWDNRYHSYGGWWRDGPSTWRADDRNSGSSEDNHSDGPRAEQADSPAEHRAGGEASIPKANAGDGPRRLRPDPPGARDHGRPLGREPERHRGRADGVEASNHGGKGPSEKLLIPTFSGEDGDRDLGTSARSYLRQVAAWERMTKLASNQQALVLYQHLQGAAWVNAESLDVDRLGDSDGVDYLKDWIRQHYLDVEVTSVGRSLSDLFRKLRRRPSQTFRDYAAEFNRLLARVVECGCRLPDVATAWLFVDRANLDETTEVSLLASVGNRYALRELQQAAIILDRSMRKPWEKVGRQDGGRRHQIVHHTSDAEALDDDETVGDDETSTLTTDDQDHDDLYIAYLTGKIRNEGRKGKNFDPEIVRRTAEDRIKAAKAKSFCSACGQRGHWHRDPVCPRRRGDNAGTGSRDDGRRAQTVHVVNEIYEVGSDTTGGLMAITDSACSKNVMGTGWLQKYLDMMRGCDFNPDFVHEREAFRFGASRVYESSYAAIILIALGGKWIAVKAAVVHGDVPLLLSRPCLAHLGMILDVEKNTADFRAVNVRNFTLHSTSTGHPAIPVSHKGLTLPCVKNLPKAWRDEGVEILNPRVVYMTGAAGTGGVQGSVNSQCIESKIDDPNVQNYPKIFFDKKIDEATKKMLTGDSLNLNTFLCWWNSTNISNDFWIEGPRPSSECT